MSRHDSREHPHNHHHDDDHHPRHHRHPGHHHHKHNQRAHSHGFARHVQELASMGASQEDLHSVIDQHVKETIEHGSDISTIHDPGHGTEDEPVDALDRARTISQALHESEDAWRSSLRDKHVLVAGEFPPHLLEELLDANIAVTQLHPMHEGNFEPPHFHHLAPYGLRGITSLHDLVDVHCDAVLVHGAEIDTEIRVSPLVPIVLRIFPNAEKFLLLDDHVAPHMIVRIHHNGFRRVSMSL